ncbi:MAG: alpha/beta hydrolase [Myxococcales bacterium]|nr:alpha/beta hydrolase [Myxococcales bacterium]
MNEPDGYVQNGGVRLAYWERGKGPETLLLIMGIVYRAAFFRQQFIDALAQHFRVVLFDNRGTGYSTKPVEHITADLWASDAIAVLDALGIERTSLLGYSMGGRVAQQLMVDHPERLERIILLSATVGGPEGVPPEDRALTSFVIEPGADPEAARRSALLSLCGPGLDERDPETVETFVELGRTKRTPASVVQKQLMVANTNVCPRLSETRAPCQIVHGNCDPLVPPQNADILKRCLPHADLVKLDGYGHFLQWEAVDELTAIVLPFLRD